jgi:hypothetical protein
MNNVGGVDLNEMIAIAKAQFKEIKVDMNHHPFIQYHFQNNTAVINENGKVDKDVTDID